VGGSEQYGLTIKRTSDRFAGDPAATKNNDSICHPDHFLRVVANENDGESLSRQVRDDAMDFCLGADVNAARRFVEEE
jgi:hypothetical protein